MINFDNFIEEVITQLKTNNSELFKISYSENEIDEKYTWEYVSGMIDDIDIENIQHELENEKFNNSISYINDIEKQLSELEEKVFEDYDDIFYSIGENLNYLRMELEDDEDFEKTKNEIGTQKDKCANLADLVSNMDDMIVNYKDYTNEIYSLLIKIFNDAVNNNGQINIFDYIYIDDKNKNQFNSLWKS